LITLPEQKRDSPYHLDQKRDIQQKAKEHGFDLCYFTRPQLKKRDTDALDHWLAKGRHADMAWMAESTRLERRKKPHLMMNDVQTVICVGMRHQPPEYSLQQAEHAKAQGVIASYAHGADYHDVMKKRLKALARDLDLMLGVHQQRVYVDTAPVLEHALAASAGLGWQGKHTLTIHRQYGSYMMLAEIFTTAEIEVDDDASAHCGRCTACLDICPTQAIVAPYVVDANRCISYLTIEYRGMIPLELRQKMGNRIYGCDDCQAICPWNRKAVKLEEDLLVARGENILPQLGDFLSMDEDAFRQRFRKSPVKRTGRAAFLRNVCVAMGNSGDARFIPLLLDALHDDEALIRAHAVWALKALMGEDALLVETLRQLQMNEQDFNVLQEIAQCGVGKIASGT